MLDAITSLFTLRWTDSPKFYPLPSTITRTFITNPKTPGKQLELLFSSSSSTASTPPILFLHGGFGSASVWLDLMTYLAPTTQTYALSLRNHGASYTVPFLRMVYGTTVSDLSSDIVTAITHITTQTGHTPILVAHSSGGGLAQYILANSLATTPRLVLLDAVPHFGNLSVNAAWIRRDPWFMLRMLFHFNHPTSPLSSLRLLREAFFGAGDRAKGTPPLSDSQVQEFRSWMPTYESLMWPMAMSGGFVAWCRGRPEWLDVRRLLMGMTGEQGGRGKVCVMVGSEDVLMEVELERRAAEELRVGMGELERVKKRDGSGGEVVVEEEDDEKVVDCRDGVSFVIIKGAGHHSQNDIQWRVVAEEMRKFVVA